MISIFQIFLQNKTRFLLTFLSVFSGTIIILIMLSFGNALSSAFIKAIQSSGVNVIEFSIIHQKMEQSHNSLSETIGRDIFFTDKDVMSIKSLPYLKNVMGVYRSNVLMRVNALTQYCSLMGVNSMFFRIKNISLQKGHFFNSYNDTERNRVIVLGYQLNQEFFHGRGLGKNIFIQGIPFKIIGITKQGFHLTKMDDIEAYTAWIPLRTYRGMFRSIAYNNIIGVSRNIIMSNALGNLIKQVLLNLHGVNCEIRMRDYAQMQKSVFLFMVGFEIFLFIIGATTLALSGLSVATVIFLSIYENRRYIGIHMALGATPFYILRYYLLEGTMMILSSGCVGIIFSFFILKCINFILKRCTSYLFLLGQLNLYLSPILIIIILFLLTLIGIIASFFPAKKVSSILPAEALRCV